jgi:hypothetical protein
LPTPFQIGFGTFPAESRESSGVTDTGGCGRMGRTIDPTQIRRIGLGDPLQIRMIQAGR